MRTAALVFFLLALGGAATHGQGRLGTAADEAAILRNRDAQNAAYNNHDAKAYAALAAVDADRIDGAGTYSGREGIERYYANGMKANPSTVKDEVRSVRFLTAEVAMLEVDNVITRPGRITRNHASFVYVKRNGRWEMVAQRVIPKP